MFDTFPPSAEKRQKRTRTIPPAEMYQITPFALTGFASSGQAGHRVDEFLFQKNFSKGIDKFTWRYYTTTANKTWQHIRRLYREQGRNT